MTATIMTMARQKPTVTPPEDRVLNASRRWLLARGYHAPRWYGPLDWVLSGHERVPGAFLYADLAGCYRTDTAGKRTYLATVLTQEWSPERESFLELLAIRSMFCVLGEDGKSLSFHLEACT